MKEATGDLNMSVIVVTLVAILSTFFFSVLWPRIKTNFKHNSRCDDAICTCPVQISADGKCDFDGTMVECYFKEDKNKKIMCPWKG